MTVKKERKTETQLKSQIGLEVKKRGREKINVRIGISNEEALAKKRGI